jgi:nucleotide-binding universal stress UspA family protein
MTGIVVGVDGSADADAALTWAMADARRRGTTVTAILVWTADDCPTTVLERAYGPGGPTVETAAQQVLGDAVRRARIRAGDSGVTVVERAVYRDAVETLLDAAADADMLVVGHRGTDTLQRLVMGSISGACLRRATAPVVVVRAQGTPNDSGPVLVGVDGSAVSIEALRWAATEAALRGVTLQAVHARGRAASEETARAVLRDSLDQCPATAGLTIDARLVAGEAADNLLTIAAEAQLLVVGTRGHAEFDRLPHGAVRDRCIRHAPCPVAVIYHRPGGPDADAP